MIEAIHSFLVHPAKHQEEQPEISRSIIEATGQLYSMLQAVFERAPEECDIDIVFCSNKSGEQQNDCRECLVAYAQNPTLSNGHALAIRLQRVTTHRSGMGLLFLMKGNLNGTHAIVVSRFPADQGILAEEHEEDLTVEFIERIFMKNAKAYKSAIYTSDSLEVGFWVGKAVDRQISGPRELSDYWIREFLSSELSTTSAAGTKRLALALRNAVKMTQNLDIRRELVSVATLLRGHDGRTSSARGFIERLGLTEPAVTALESAYIRPDLMDETFRFDSEEFDKHAHYRAVELDSGAMLVAEDADFDRVFSSEILSTAEKRIRYTTEGKIVDERLRRTR